METFWTGTAYSLTRILEEGDWKRVRSVPQSRVSRRPDKSAIVATEALSKVFFSWLNPRRQQSTIRRWEKGVDFFSGNIFSLKLRLAVHIVNATSPCIFFDDLR